MYGIDIFFKFRYALLSKRIYKIRNSFSAPGIATIIFSKDRAIQLCALLETFFLNKKGDCKVVVIYKASTNKHKFAYDELVNIYGGNVDFISETEHGGFKASLKVAIGCISLGKIFFLVDDIVFTEPVDFDLLSQIDLRNHIFSLRMGRNLSYSYVVSSEQELPREIKRSDNFIE